MPKLPALTPPPSPRAFMPGPIVVRFAKTYGVMISLGVLSCSLLNRNLASLWQLPTSAALWRYYGLLILLGAGIIVGCQELCRQIFPAYAAERRATAKLLGAISLPEAFFLATISAVGEELLFRGALQPCLGVITTSMALAILHLTAEGTPTPVMLVAFAMSLTLGYLVQFSGSLYPGLAIHLALNLVFLVRHSLSCQQGGASQQLPGHPTRQERDSQL